VTASCSVKNKLIKRLQEEQPLPTRSVFHSQHKTMMVGDSESRAKALRFTGVDQSNKLRMSQLEFSRHFEDNKEGSAPHLIAVPSQNSKARPNSILTGSCVQFGEENDYIQAYDGTSEVRPSENSKFSCRSVTSRLFPKVKRSNEHQASILAKLSKRETSLESVSEHVRPMPREAALQKQRGALSPIRRSMLQSDYSRVSDSFKLCSNGPKSIRVFEHVDTLKTYTNFEMSNGPKLESGLNLSKTGQAFARS